MMLRAESADSRVIKTWYVVRIGTTLIHINYELTVVFR